METKELSVLNAIAGEMASLEGDMSFYYKNLTTGFTYGVAENEARLAASVIKFPLFLHVLKECSEGRLSLDDRLVTEMSDKVPSCGALNLFTGPVETDIRTLCRLMIDISDNTATNRLLRHFTLPKVEEGFAALGLEKTRIRRFLFDIEASRRGVQNTICLTELGALLEALYRGEFIDAETSRFALDVLLAQQIDHKLNGKLCDAYPIAHKTGEDDELSNDIGIVYAPQPFVIGFAGNNVDVYRWEDLIRRGTYELCRVQEQG